MAALTDIDESLVAEHAAAAVAVLLSQSASRVKKSAAQRSVDAIACLYADAAVRGLTAPGLRDTISSGLSPAAVEVVCAAYAENVGALQAALVQQGPESTRVMTASWQLTHSLGDRTTAAPKAARSLPVVTVALRTTRGLVEFACTSEQLHDLANELNSAIASVSRLSRTQ